MSEGMPPETTCVSLRSGTLSLCVEHAAMPLTELCGYASRRSRKRGFVFLSKVLGKHYPVRPGTMNRVHARLAAELKALPGPALVIALAETATGLGHGIFERLIQSTGRTDLVFLHTTRYRLSRPLALHFEESHSHAPEHLVYEPAAAVDAELFRTAATLVLIDDELSTGRTLANLAIAYRRLNPRLGAVEIVCLTDWLSASRRAEIAREIGVPTRFHSLLRGRFRFEEDPEFDAGILPSVTGRGDLKDGILRGNQGRLGVRGLAAVNLERLAEQTGVRPGESLLVLGSGEFAYPPYLLARFLEERGWHVHYQSTTRSPLLLGGDVASVLEFVDNYQDEMPNYLYNVADRRYDRILIGYETRPLPASHRLPEMLGAHTVFF